MASYVCMAMYLWLCMYGYVCMAMYVWRCMYERIPFNSHEQTLSRLKSLSTTHQSRSSSLFRQKALNRHCWWTKQQPSILKAIPCSYINFLKSFFLFGTCSSSGIIFCLNFSFQTSSSVTRTRNDAHFTSYACYKVLDDKRIAQKFITAGQYFHASQSSVLT